MGAWDIEGPPLRSASLQMDYSIAGKSPHSKSYQKTNQTLSASGNNTVCSTSKGQQG